MESREQTQLGATQEAAKEYNYEHFHSRIMSKDMKLTMRSQGPHPGDKAPDFELMDTDGRTWRLSQLRGKPVVLIVGSASCPMTYGGLPAIRDVYRDFADRAQWLFMYVREAHPGESLPAHRTYEQKCRHADFLKRDEQIDWPILVDELDGKMHRAYGTLPNSVFVIDIDGRVSFRGDYSHGPSLRRALENLFEQGGQGVVPQGEDHMMHMLGALAYGWDAIEQSGDVATHDIFVELPPLALNLWMGRRMRPILDPVATRSRPLPAALKIGVLAGLGLIAFGAWKMMRSASR